jgi:hypothetical protein
VEPAAQTDHGAAPHLTIAAGRRSSPSIPSGAVGGSFAARPRAVGPHPATERTIRGESPSLEPRDPLPTSRLHACLGSPRSLSAHPCVAADTPSFNFCFQWSQADSGSAGRAITSQQRARHAPW